MKNLTAKQIEQIKGIKVWHTTKFHGNRKYVGVLPVEFYKEILAKKAARDMLNCRGIYVHCTPVVKSNVRTVKDLLKRSIECKGTGYFKTLIEGNTGIYYASPVYGHSDYNKSRVLEKTPETMKLMRLFNAIVSR